MSSLACGSFDVLLAAAAMTSLTERWAALRARNPIFSSSTLFQHYLLDALTANYYPPKESE